MRCEYIPLRCRYGDGFVTGTRAAKVGELVAPVSNVRALCRVRRNPLNESTQVRYWQSAGVYRLVEKAAALVSLVLVSALRVLVKRHWFHLMR